MSAIEKAISQLGKREKPAQPKRPRSSATNWVHTSQVPTSAAQKVVEQNELPENNAPIDLGSALHQTQNQVGDTASVSSDAAVPSSKALTAAKQIELPFEKMAQLGYISLDHPRSQIAEEYRAIKRPLLLRAEQCLEEQVDYANVLMVTSSIQGEGKTFSAINLALSMAMERDKTVLFIDTDIVTAAASAVFGLGREIEGLVEALSDKSRDLADLIVKTDIPNFKIIPAGSRSDHATELLASVSMKNLLRDLSYKYPDRIVIFDAPPILQTNEARILATLAGQIIFVVSANTTSQSNVTEALSHLNKDKPVGLLLNRSFNAANDGYGYNYGSYAESVN